MIDRSDYLIWIGVAAAAGAVIGLLAEREHPVQGGLLGAAAGILAGSAAAGVCEHIKRNEIPYYSSLSPLYDEAEVA
jgi:hypothetical protein